MAKSLCSLVVTLAAMPFSATLLPAVASAEPAPVQWESVGPRNLPPPKGQTGVQSGATKLVVVDPHNSKVMLLGSTAGGGLYRTVDGGATWQRPTTPPVGADGVNSGAMTALWLNPQAPNEVLAATEDDGIFRSSDGGKTWGPVWSGAGIQGFISTGNELWAAGHQGILTSSDGGRSWTLAFATPAPLVTVSAVATQVWAGGKDGAVYVRRGGTWSKVGQLPAAVHQLAVDPNALKTVYASVLNGPYNYNLYASLDAGATWTQIAWDKALLGVQVLAFGAAVPHRLYVAGDGSAIWTTADGNPNPVYTRAALHGDLRTLILTPNAAKTDDHCLVGSDQGLQLAENCSVAKSQLDFPNHGLALNVVSDFAVSADGNRLVAAMTDFAAVWSQDRGATWNWLTLAGQGGGENGYVAIDPTDPTHCYHFRKGIHVSRDGCNTFTQTNPAISHVSSSGSYLSIDAGTPGSLYVVTHTPPGILHSLDFGATFGPVATPLVDPRAIVVSPRSSQHLLAGSDTTLVVSFDGGQSWVTPSGLPTKGSGFSVAVSPASDLELLAVWPEKGALHAFASHDGGRSFAFAGEVVQPRQWKGSLTTVVFGSGPRPSVVVTTTNGAYLSADGGSNWRRIDNELTTHHISGAHWLEHHLYLATYGEGIFRSRGALE